MTTGSRLAGYRARVAAKAADTLIHASEIEDPAAPVEGEPEEENVMTNPTNPITPAPVAAAPVVVTPPVAAAPVAAAPDGVARMKAVFASDKVKGQEARAAEMLADADFDSLTAEGIIKILGATPAAAAPVAGDDEVGKRMLAAMTVETPDIGSGGQSEEDKAKAEVDWDKIHAEVAERNKLSA